MRRFSSLLMALMVTVLLWGNCVQCSTVLPPDAGHDCCHKPQHGKPLKQNCDLNAADLAKATAAGERHTDQPLAESGEPASIGTIFSKAAVAALTPPPEFCLLSPDFSVLHSVFRL
jgi:hypothetical protein